MSRIWTVLMLLCGAVLLSIAPAKAQGLAVSARAGSLGPGLDVTASVAPRLNARVGVSYLTYAHSDILHEEIDVRYDADLTLTSVTAMLDWHPFRNAVRFSAGAVYNGNKVDAVITPIESYTIKEKTFSPDRIGTLTARVDYKSKISPYVGLGLGNAVSRRFGVAFDLGLLYTNSPSVRMTGSGMIAPTAGQAAKLEQGFESFKFYPLVSVGLSFSLWKP